MLKNVQKMEFEFSRNYSFLTVTRHGDDSKILLVELRDNKIIWKFSYISLFILPFNVKSLYVYNFVRR